MVGRPGPATPSSIALGRFAHAVRRRLKADGVVLVDQVMAFSPPFEFWTWLGTETDAERDALLASEGLHERVRRIADKHGLADLLEGVHVESQETVDRDYEGSWFYAMR